jgi:hypothetical protein
MGPARCDPAASGHDAASAVVGCEIGVPVAPLQAAPRRDALPRRGVTESAPRCARA